MKKIVLLVALVVSAVAFGSCTSYTCPTYSMETPQQAPSQLDQQNL
ncbi:MAG: hypothetical protein KDC79_07135 [Cyclobacteriaceae bacterium]|nr:hypothetical protein [Cyclobacteriaceae bacterium]